MAEREFTLLELHFHSHGDVSVAPDTGSGGSMASRLLGREEAGGSAERTRGRTGEAEDSGSSPLVAAGAVLAVALAAFVLRRLRAGEASRAERARERLP